MLTLRNWWNMIRKRENEQKKSMILLGGICPTSNSVEKPGSIKAPSKWKHRQQNILHARIVSVRIQLCCTGVTNFFCTLLLDNHHKNRFRSKKPRVSSFRSFFRINLTKFEPLFLLISYLIVPPVRMDTFFEFSWRCDGYILFL